MPNNRPSQPSKRLFIALWPPPDVQRQLQSLQTHISGGVPVAADNLHATLAFLGAMSHHQEQLYAQAIRALDFAPCTLMLDTLGWWKKPRALWAGCQTMPDALLALVQDLNEKLAPCGFTPEDRPFTLHVTLVRKYARTIADEHRAIPAIAWRADTVALVESRGTAHGVRYLPLVFQHARGVL